MEHEGVASPRTGATRIVEDSCRFLVESIFPQHRTGNATHELEHAKEAVEWTASGPRLSYAAPLPFRYGRGG